MSHGQPFLGLRLARGESVLARVQQSSDVVERRLRSGAAAACASAAWVIDCLIVGDRISPALPRPLPLASCPCLLLRSVSRRPAVADPDRDGSEQRQLLGLRGSAGIGP